MSTDNPTTDISNAVAETLIPHTAYCKAIEKVEQCFRYSATSVDPICLPLHGETRTGKTTIIRETLRMHPVVRAAEGLQVPVLVASAPSKPTVKGLAEVLLMAIGDPKFHAGTENKMTARLKKLMRAAGTRMVIIDEFHHFVDKSSAKVIHHVADWLKLLVDDTGVALLVAGLPECQAVISQNEQLRGRFLSPVVMPRFDWFKENERAEYIAILRAFRESLSRHFDLPQIDGEVLAFRFYVGTGGLVGYVAKFLTVAVRNAVDRGSSEISLANLHSAHMASIWENEGEALGPSPFARSFDDSATERAGAVAKSVGLRAEPAPRARKTTVTPTKPGINTALAAT